MTHPRLALDGPICYRASEESGMKPDLHPPQELTALLCNATGVDAQETKSLCCAAAGIVALPSSTHEVLIPHEKLRAADAPDATLMAQDRPPAQPVVGYMHVSGCVDAMPECETGRRYWVINDNYVIDHGHDGTRISKKGLALMVGNFVFAWPMMALINPNADRDELALLKEVV